MGKLILSRRRGYILIVIEKEGREGREGNNDRVQK